MKKIYFYMMLMLASLAVTMSSCGGWDSPYYVDDIVGNWVSYYGHDSYGEYDIMGRDVVSYTFYSNYTGRYTYYSYYGLSYVDFDWYTSGDRLIIHYYDGDSDYLYYGFDRNGDLLMATDSRFYHYTAYRPTGYYYDQAKPLPDDDKTALDKTVPLTSESRAIKARAQAADK